MLDTVLERPAVSDTFTPGQPNLNAAMYIDRAGPEAALTCALSGERHLSLSGAAGVGKSWLYQRVLADRQQAYFVIDLSLAPLIGLDYALDNALLVGGAAEAQAPTSRRLDASFEYLHLRARATGQDKCLLVFENVEQIDGDSESLHRLGTLLETCKDEPRLQFLFVGRSDIRDMGAALHPAFASHVDALPEIAALSLDETHELVTQGFETLLKLRTEISWPLLTRRIHFITGGLVQDVHSLCQAVAEAALEFHNGSIRRTALADFEP